MIQGRYISSEYFPVTQTYFEITLFFGNKEKQTHFSRCKKVYMDSLQPSTKDWNKKQQHYGHFVVIGKWFLNYSHYHHKHYGKWFFFPKIMATLWWFLNFAGHFSEAKILELETSMAGAATVPWTQGRDGMVGVRYNGSDGGQSTPED